MVHFKGIYDEYKNKIYFSVKKLVKNDDDIEDIVQEIFVHLWKYNDVLKKTENIESIIYKTTKQEIINFYRKNKVTFLEIAEDTLEFPEESIDYSYVQENASKIDKLLEQIPEKSRIFFLKYQQDNLSYSQIGEEYNISKQAVEQHVKKVIRFLKNNIAK